jgi:hypothetical protein
MDGRMDGWVGGWMGGWMDRLIDSIMYSHTPTCLPDRRNPTPTAQPTAFLYLTSIGHIGSDTNPDAAKALTDLVHEKLQIPKNRIFIQFVDSSAANFGWQGNTFG